MSRHAPVIDAALTELRQRLQSLQSDCSALVIKPKRKAQPPIGKPACEEISDATYEALETIRSILAKLRLGLGQYSEALDNGEQSGAIVDRAKDEAAEEHVAKKRRTGPPGKATVVAETQADNANVQSAKGSKKIVSFTEKQVLARLKSAAAEFAAHGKGFPQYVHSDFDNQALLDILEIMQREVKELAGALAEMLEGDCGREIRVGKDVNGDESKEGRSTEVGIAIKTGKSKANAKDQNIDGKASALTNSESPPDNRIDRENVIRTAAMDPSVVVPTIEGTQRTATGAPTDVAEYFKALAQSLKIHADFVAKHDGSQVQLIMSDDLEDGLSLMMDALQVQADELQNSIKHWPERAWRAVRSS
ncbi:hypothetical protein LTR95_002624 [Oleoguttula sp. CCFEE 5521]